MSKTSADRTFTVHQIVTIAAILTIVAFSVTTSANEDTGSRKAENKVTHEQRLVSTAFASAQQLIKSAAARPLQSDPFFEDLGGFLATADDTRSPDALVRPQLQMSRDLETLPDGTLTSTPNQLRIDVTAPSGGGRNLCRVVLAFSFPQFSPLASGNLTVDRALQALADTSRNSMQVEEVFVSPETTYDGTAILHSSSLSSMQVIYSPQNGGFLTQPPSIIDELQPTTPAEFAQTEGLLTQVSNCITQSFDNEQANNENPVSQTTTIDENELRTMGVCAVPCSITGRVAFEHPTWGASRLLTVVALDAADWEAHMLAVDSDSNIRWRYDTDEWAELAPANDTPGKSGNIFITYNPGRYDGIVVLQPSTEGFNDFDTLPENDYFAGRFYGASIADVNSDGVFEVVIDQMTCAPECTTDIEYFWDGINYAEK